MLLFGELHPFLEPTNLHSHAIPPINELLAVLHFLGNASYQMVAGELAGLSKSLP